MTKNIIVLIAISLLAKLASVDAIECYNDCQGKGILAELGMHYASTLVKSQS